MWESKIVYFFGAVLLSLAGAMTVAEGKPDSWQLWIMGVTALAQGLLALKAFVTPPPAP